MKYIFTLIILLFLIPYSVKAQQWEVGALIGGSNYVGDLSHHRLVMSETNFAGGGILRFNFSPKMVLKGNIYYGSITGTDENAQDEQHRIRNLHFRSSILDIGMQIEYHLLGTRRIPGNYRMSPYIMGGVSIFRFNPQAEIDGQWFDLQPLGTEGQETVRYQHRKKYSLTQLAIPIGFGFKHSLTNRWNIGFEVGYRITFTDYLDDVSTTYVHQSIITSTTGERAYRLSNRSYEYIEENNLDVEPFGDGDARGDPTRNDHFLFAGFTLTYVLFPPACPTF